MVQEFMLERERDGGDRPVAAFEATVIISFPSNWPSVIQNYCTFNPININRNNEYSH